MTVRVLENACVGCGSCVAVCPTDALSVWGLSKCDPDLCNDCMVCIPYCPVDALTE